MFFKITNAIVELGDPPLVWDSALIFVDGLEAEVSKLKDKWVREFDSLTDFSEESIKAWTIDYVNWNNNIPIIFNEAWEEIIEIENEIFEMNIKHEITIPPLQDFITEWLEKLLVAVAETN